MNKEIDDIINKSERIYKLVEKEILKEEDNVTVQALTIIEVNLDKLKYIYRDTSSVSDVHTLIAKEVIDAYPEANKRKIEKYLNRKMIFSFQSIYGKYTILYAVILSILCTVQFYTIHPNILECDDVYGIIAGIAIALWIIILIICYITITLFDRIKLYKINMDNVREGNKSY